MSLTPEHDYAEDQRNVAIAPELDTGFDDAFLLMKPRKVREHSMAILSIEQSFGDKQNLLSKFT